MYSTQCDVLIVGAGLAGLRAALTASNYGAEVLIVNAAKGAWGSSFVNFNERLGMQVLKTDIEKEHFTQRAIQIAKPGKIFPELVKIMAEESYKRFLDLKKLGATFENNNTRPVKYPGCFDPHQKTAIMIQNLKKLYENFLATLKARIKILSEWLLIKLLKNPDEDSICGAIFVNKKNEILAIQAKSVILATGGCASLFPWNIACTLPGYSLGILEDVGATLCNEGYIQWLWVEKDSKRFFSFDHKLSQITILKNGKKAPVLHKILEHTKERITHCPIGYNLRDFEIDRFFIHYLTGKGVKIYNEQGEIINIVPAAQAQNGGALIDHTAMTSIPGLFACGECASGMHGANRIGGAMVLATQVFGHRSGKFAYFFAKEKSFLSDELFTNLINDNTDNTKETSCYNFLLKRDLLHLNWSNFIKGFILNDKKVLGQIKNHLKKLIYRCEVEFSRLRLKTLKVVVESRMNN